LQIEMIDSVNVLVEELDLDLEVGWEERWDGPLEEDFDLEECLEEVLPER
jgi:hypothetical protein